VIIRLTHGTARTSFCLSKAGLNVSVNIDATSFLLHDSPMSTLVQIESAVAGLPQQEQWSLLVWLQTRLTREPRGTVLPQQQSQADLEQWLANLAVLRAQTSAGRAVVPLQQLMDDIRDERF
jgi:hypothetical protein